tara:strand:- start:11000 stop:12241 length:1242 start_codon:yes stop_codon:yes gene_type:complete
MKRVLMIAYHFPPLAGSSGIQRTLRFAEHLPEFGWSPIILTVHPRAYEHTHAGLLAEIPPSVQVLHAPAWDASRHFSVARRYPRFLALPDRWASWRWGGIASGLLALRRYRPAAIWSTYPIATAHTIGSTLSRLGGLPWMADFRDPMAQDGYPTDPTQWQHYLQIEQRTIAQAAASTFVAPGALAHYRQRYPSYAERMHLIENGYDDSLAHSGEHAPSLNPGQLTLLHSGIVYPSERDPSHFFEALAQLRMQAPELFGRLRIRFRGAIHDDLLHALARQHHLEESIQICPITDYRNATREMQAADGLLLMQASNCNQQIPAKFYEYLSTRRPILTLSDPTGDTNMSARAAGLTACAPLDDTPAIVKLLHRFASTPDEGTHAREASIEAASRRARTATLAALLNTLVAHGSALE